MLQLRPHRSEGPVLLLSVMVTVGQSCSWGLCLGLWLDCSQVLCWYPWLLLPSKALGIPKIWAATWSCWCPTITLLLGPCCSERPGLLPRVVVSSRSSSVKANIWFWGPATAGVCVHVCSLFTTGGSYQPWVMESESYDEPVKHFADHGKVGPTPLWTPQQDGWPHHLPWAWGTGPDGTGIGKWLCPLPEEGQPQWPILTSSITTQAYSWALGWSTFTSFLSMTWWSLLRIWSCGMMRTRSPWLGWATGYKRLVSERFQRGSGDDGLSRNQRPWTIPMTHHMKIHK